MRILPLVAIVLLLGSCGTGNKPQAEAPATVAPAPKAEAQSSLEPAGTARLLVVLDKYYALKDALVASDAKTALSAAASLSTAADSLKSVAGSYAELDSVRHFSAQIQAGAAADIEVQRSAFEHVSDNLFALLQKAGLKNAGVYRQFCPMAFDDKGANWLSNTDEIRNPYFGKKMLECGEVTDSLK